MTGSSICATEESFLVVTISTLEMDEEDEITALRR